VLPLSLVLLHVIQCINLRNLLLRLVLSFFCNTLIAGVVRGLLHPCNSCRRVPVLSERRLAVSMAASTQLVSSDPLACM